MDAIRNVALSLGCLIALIVARAFFYAGVYEIALGHRPPGALGWSLIRTSGSSQATWSSTRWRRNGMQVVVMAFGLLVLALWAALALFKCAAALGRDRPIPPRRIAGPFTLVWG